MFLESHFNEKELENDSFYLASDSKRVIIEEIADIYLAYIYDNKIKEGLIRELVLNVWNNQQNDGSM